MYLDFNFRAGTAHHTAHLIKGRLSLVSKCTSSTTITVLPESTKVLHLRLPLTLRSGEDWKLCCCSAINKFLRYFQQTHFSTQWWIRATVWASSWSWFSQGRAYSYLQLQHWRNQRTVGTFSHCFPYYKWFVLSAAQKYSHERGWNWKLVSNFADSFSYSHSWSVCVIRLPATAEGMEIRWRRSVWGILDWSGMLRIFHNLPVRMNSKKT